MQKASSTYLGLKPFVRNIIIILYYLVLQYVKITAIIGAVIVGEPNNSKETAVHLYAKDLSEQYISRWNDTYNKYDGANTYFSYKNCGIICEWENNPGDTVLYWGKCKLILMKSTWKVRCK